MKNINIFQVKIQIRNLLKDACLEKLDRRPIPKIKCNVSHICLFICVLFNFLADLELKNHEWNFDFNKEKPISDKLFVWETVSGMWFDWLCQY